MPFDIGVIRLDRYVELRVSGPTSIGAFVELVEAIENESLFWSDRRVLADLCGVQGRLTDPEQVFLGELVGQRLGHLERMASLVPPEQITRNSEGAAQKLGMQLRVFTSREEADAWLRAEALA